MTEVNLIRNRHLVEDLGGALRSGQHGLATVPALLKRLLAEESWRQFTTQRGEHVTHVDFANFVTTPPLAGIGASRDLLYRLASGDDALLDELDRAYQKPHGGDRRSVEFKRDVITLEKDPNPRGTSREYALRKLRDSAPELHGEVVAGRLSAHAAMVQAGFRSSTFTISPEPASAARSLRKHLSPEQLAELLRILADGVDG